MKDKVLTKRQRDALANTLPRWTLGKQGTVLRREVPLASYLDGLIIIARLTVHANILNHHPEVTLKPGKLTIVLTTHDSGGITKKDVALAQYVDETVA